ncbi:uncharacterized protein PAC_11827 [Phialocephala subalpina]|uniref:Apple domain-containing protein n=1 Tax=Phialocephala subalpina TaxID=576137 RepID=A0A1L7XA77_9HELO|nr:uncharacterized protein PAC_11827 [Phialocephala subalpina]
MGNKLVILLLVTEALASVFQRGGCNADNCARAVTGTRYAPDVQASHMADCSSFMMETITPATPTSTVTLTGTSYSVVGSNAKRTAAPLAKKDSLKPRDVALDSFLVAPTSIAAAATTTAAGVKARQVTVVPNSVPIYASACSGTVRYSSACSCAGITVSTTYAPTPATTTTTVYAQASIIPVCDPAQNYGYHYVGGSIQAGVGLVRGTSALSEQACCASCYTEGSSCFVYEFFNNICFLVTETSGGHAPTDYCPYGVFGISGPGAGSFYGFGPCAVIG